MSEICPEICPFRATVETLAPALMHRIQSQHLMLFSCFMYDHKNVHGGVPPLCHKRAALSQRNASNQLCLDNNLAFQWTLEPNEMKCLKKSFFFTVKM